MSTGPEDFRLSDTPSDEPTSGGVPPLEDDSDPEAMPAETVMEDAAEEMRLDTAARSLNGGDLPLAAGDFDAAVGEAETRPASGDEAGSDAGILGEAPEPVVLSRRHRVGDWESELSAHAVGIELKCIEDEVRAILEDRDPRRKRRLNGTSRWQELEDDLISWRFSGRFSEDALRRLGELIARRHHLFRHLRFLASTRPTWNS